MTEPLSVVFQRRAIREAEAIDEWWRSNRSSAPDLFVAELEAMLGAAALMPTLASTTGSATSGSRCLLSGTRRAEPARGCSDCATRRLPPVCHRGVGSHHIAFACEGRRSSKTLTTSQSRVIDRCFVNTTFEPRLPDQLSF
jgi:hypothetical protein